MVAAGDLLIVVAVEADGSQLVVRLAGEALLMRLEVRAWDNNGSSTAIGYVPMPPPSPSAPQDVIVDVSRLALELVQAERRQAEAED